MRGVSELPRTADKEWSFSLRGESYRVTRCHRRPQTWQVEGSCERSNEASVPSSTTVFSRRTVLHGISLEAD